jgi:hypothetical protein
METEICIHIMVKWFVCVPLLPTKYRLCISLTVQANLTGLLDLIIASSAYKSWINHTDGVLCIGLENYTVVYGTVCVMI